MKANEFVKKFGVSSINIENVWFDFGCSSERAFEEIYGFGVVEDLKRLVESHELVVSYGGVGKSRLKVQGNRLSYKKTAALWKAILDVESCQ